MRGTQPETALASHCDAVTAMIRAGTPFGDVEAAIDGAVDLTTDQKAAAWLLAFSLRDRRVQHRDASAHLADVL